jgi:hypothetical protein
VPRTQLILGSLVIELEKIRDLAEQADNAVLAYLIDMAIREAGSSGANGEDPPEPKRKPLISKRRQ